MATQAQFREIMSILLGRTQIEENSPWSRIPSERVQSAIKDPNKFSDFFVQFVANEGRLIVGELKKFAIDRSSPFDPVKFIGSGWSIWKGPKDGKGLEGEEQQDSRSLKATELDLSQLCFEHCVEKKESFILGETKLVRLKESEERFIRADAKMAQALFEEPGHRTLEWIRVNLGKTWFDFPGTELRDPDGLRCILYLFWYGGQWDWRCSWLDYKWYAKYPSLLLPASLLAGQAGQLSKT